MQDLETRIRAERAAENSAFSSGFETLNKSLKAVFTLLVAAIAVLLVWFFIFSGFFTVQPDTAVLTFQFGKFQKVCTESWHWVFPYPVSQTVKVKTSPFSIETSSFMPANRALITNRKEASAMGGAPDALKPGIDGYLLTGDACIVHTDWKMTARVVDPERYYKTCMTPLNPEKADDVMTAPDGERRGTRGPQTLLRAVLDDCVLRVTAGWNVDGILYNNNSSASKYQKTIETMVMKRVADLRIGVEVLRVDLELKSPPPQTINAFDNVLHAQQQSSAAIQKAEAYKIEQLALAQSESDRIVSEADSYRKRVVSDVSADAGYFKSILAEYGKSPDTVTVTLFSQVMAEAMGKVKDKFIVNSIGSGRQELRLKLNPEPLTAKEKKEAEEKNEEAKK